MKKLLIFLLLALPCLAQIHNLTPGGAGTVVSSPTNGTQVVGNSTNLVPQIGPTVEVRDFGAVGDAQVAPAPNASAGKNAAGANAVMGGYSDCWMTSGSAVLTCNSSHFSSSDVGKVIAVYGAGTTNGAIAPLATTIASYTSGTQITLAAAATNSNTQGLCSITTATWATAGTLTATCSSTANFYPNQEIVIDWSGNPTVDKQIWTVVTDSGPGFTATENSSPSFPEAALTFGSSVNGNPVIASGYSIRVVWGTDNTAAIQAAVDSAAPSTNDNQTGAIILFPAGHYLTNGVQSDCTYVGYNGCTRQYNNFRFQGSGRDTTTLENWNPNLVPAHPTLGAHGTAPAGLFDLGYYGINRDGEGTYFHYLQNAQVSGFTLIEPEGVPNANHYTAILLGATQDSDISGNNIDGGYHANYCIYGGELRDKVHDNYVTNCLEGLNVFGDFDHVYNNISNNAVICSEIAQAGMVWEGNICTAPAQYGKGIVIGSDASGAFDITVRNSTFKNMYQACAIENVDGTIDRIHITHNNFINSLNCSLGDGTTMPSGYPIAVPDTVVHGFSEFSHNTMEVANAANMPSAFVNIISTYESWTLDSNTFLVNGAIPPGSGNSPTYIDVANGAAPYWQPNSSNAAPSYNSVVQPVRPSPTNPLFLPSAACTSGSSEPSWNTTTPFVSTTTDGTCTWTYEGPMPIQQLSNNRLLGIGGGTTNSVNGPINEYCQEFTISNADIERVVVENDSIGYAGGCVYKRGHNRPNPESSGVYQMLIPANTAISDGSRYTWGVIDLGYPWTDAVPVDGYYQLNQRVNKYNASDASYWIVTRAGYAAPVWASTTAYSYESLVVPATDNGHFYAQTVVAGCTSGSTQPSFPLGTNATVNDNTCTWREVGTAAAFTLH